MSFRSKLKRGVERLQIAAEGLAILAEGHFKYAVWVLTNQSIPLNCDDPSLEHDGAILEVLSGPRLDAYVKRQNKRRESVPKPSWWTTTRG